MKQIFFKVPCQSNQGKFCQHRNRDATNWKGCYLKQRILHLNYYLKLLFDAKIILNKGN